MAYRDDLEAMKGEVDALHRENAALKRDLEAAAEKYKKFVEEALDLRRKGSRTECVRCGGSLQPIAVFAGHDIANPLPLQLSTLRFRAPTGGFTHSASVRHLACTTCGFIHSFMDMDAAEAGDAAASWPREPGP
jgi:hypothetical protein